MEELKRTYIPFKDWEEKSKQIEYTEKTPLLAPDGTLLAKGWARKNVFEYNRDYVKKGIISRKEWDFYTIFDDEMQILISFANINIGGYVAAKLLNLKTGEVICDCVQYFAGANKHVSHVKADSPGRFKDKIGKTEFDFHTKENERTLSFNGKYKGKEVMRYTYEVTNYPEYEGRVYANLIVYRNKVIGGDICSADAQGFLQGFVKTK